MSTTYPSTKQTFTDPSGTQNLGTPSHAGLHTDKNDTIEAIEDTLGTTAGTSVLKHFVAGNFPARVTGVAARGTLAQTIVGGTHDSGIFGTAVIGTSSFISGTITGTPVLDVNSIPGSALGTNTVLLAHTGMTVGTSSVISGTGALIIPGGTITFTQPAGNRAVRISGAIKFNNGATNVAHFFYIKEGGTIQTQADVVQWSAVGNHTARVYWVGTPSAGAHTYTLELTPNSGTASVALVAAQEHYFMAELI